MTDASDKAAQLRETIAALERRRDSLGAAVVDSALKPLQQQLAMLEGQPAPRPMPSLQGERRLITIMFADVSGFTSLSGTMDPELVRELISACFTCLVPIIELYGGTIEKFVGDEIMALFGAPIAHENDPERALQAAQDMMTEIAAFNRRRGTDLGLHFGINTGLVVAGAIGTAELQQYGVTGDAVNLAARLENLSERGEILLGQDTYRLATAGFEFERRPVLATPFVRPLFWPALA